MSGGDLLDGGASDPGLRAVAPCGTAGANPDLPLPAAAAALVRDRADRIVQVNAALLRLTGRTEARLRGTGLAGLVVGSGAAAQLVTADVPVPVHLLQWDVPDRELQVVVLVPREPGPEYATIGPSAAGPPSWNGWPGSAPGATSWPPATLHRSEPLQELYREIGVEPDGSGGPVEGEQVALLVRSLRGDTGLRDHEAELALPGVRLSCRAEVEFGPDGAPARLIGVVRDVTGQYDLEARARHAARRFADLAALVPTGVAIVDRDGVVREVNPALCALLDAAPEQLRGLPVAALCAEPGPDPGATALDGPLGPPLPGWLRPVPPGAAHRYQVEAVPLLRGDGTTVWCELAVSATTLDDDGWFWLLACTDVSEQRRAAELLRSAGTVDELTRLPNRAACLELLHGLLTRPGRERVAVICGDLDDFRRVNSALGHEAGDDLLVTLAGRLQRELPVGCTAARLGADEFVVISADSADAGGPEALASTVAGLLRTTLTVRGRPVQLTASVGVAVPPADDDVEAADLLRFAEVAMHDAKRSSRGGVALATDGVVGSATRDLELEAELRAAIAADALVLEYQPVVGPDGLVCTAEALVRWPHPEHGLIPPGDFLPIAQRGGLLRELDEWVLRTACREAAGWPEHGGLPGVGRGQPRRPAARRPGVPRHRHRHRRGLRPALGPAGARGRRDQPRRAARARARRDGAAGAVRGPVRHRRLRHRLLVAGPAQGAARADRQGRPRVRPRRGHRPRGLRGRARGGRHGQGDGPLHGRGGRRDDRPVPRAARGRGGGAPGLAVRAVAAAVAAARAARRRPGRGPRPTTGRLIRTNIGLVTTRAALTCRRSATGLASADRDGRQGVVGEAREVAR